MEAIIKAPAMLQSFVLKTGADVRKVCLQAYGCVYMYVYTPVRVCVNVLLLYVHIVHLHIHIHIDIYVCVCVRVSLTVSVHKLWSTQLPSLCPVVAVTQT